VTHGIRRSISFVALVVVLGFTLAACGTESESVPPTVTRVDAPGAPPTYTATVPGAATPASSPAAAGSPTTGQPATGSGGGNTAVEIDMHELAFDPNAVEIPANTDVTITLKNTGAIQHEFKIDDQNIDSGLVDSGGSTTVNVNLPAGTYTYHCPVPGHTEAGMTGTLTVK
jgi:plastocyanin